jgi:hypothetical protein
MTTHPSSTRERARNLSKCFVVGSLLAAGPAGSAFAQLSQVAWAPGEWLMPLGTFCRADKCGIPLGSTGLPYGEIIFVPIYVPSGQSATNIAFNVMSAPNGPLDKIRLGVYRSDGGNGAPGTLISDLGETQVGATGTQATPLFQTVSFPAMTFNSTGIVYIAMQVKSPQSALTFIMSNPYFQVSVGGNLVSLTTADPFVSTGDTQAYGQRTASTMMFPYAPFPAHAVAKFRWNLVPWFGLGH